MAFGVASAGAQIVPTTTLAAETGNNTSTAATFRTSTNGNIGPTNVSKVNIKKLLYAGYSGKVYMHVQPWWGNSSHINIGYSSVDAAQVARQVTDMMSRGIDGAIVDWYGPNKTWDNNATIAMKTEVDKRGGKFQFAIAEDWGALNTCVNTAGCNVTDQLISDMKYAYSTFMSSANYIRYNGRPLVFLFGLEQVAGLDWTRAAAALPWKPIFIWRNASGFNKPVSGGSFAWINPTNSTTNWGQSYLDNFYATSMNFPTSLTVAAGYKGFNDSMASWGTNRTLPQMCGQTWLKSMAEIGKYYSSSKQFWGVQIPTWNDYEEGSEIESGIDNCLSISASASGNTLNWSINGQENTLDHYTIFASTDGVNLAALGDVAASARSVDVSQYGLPSGSYKLYVKAVGKPSIVNHMSGVVSYASNGGGGSSNQPPVAKLAVTPNSGTAPTTVTATTAGSVDPDGSIASTSINWGDGATTAAASGSHAYSAGGTYTVKATVTDNRGATNSATQTVTITSAGAPAVKLSVTPATGATPVNVTASTAGTTVASGSTVASTTINWGDGATTAAASGSHSYSAAGSYTITAKVTDSRGLSSTATATVTATSGYGVVVSLPTVLKAPASTAVRFVASATSNAAVTAMRIYVDSVSVFSANAAKLDTYLKLGVGTRNVTVQAWDATGKVYKNSFQVTMY